VSGYLKEWKATSAPGESRQLLAEIDAPDLDSRSCRPKRISPARGQSHAAETTLERGNRSSRPAGLEADTRHGLRTPRIAGCSQIVAGDLDRLRVLEKYKRITAPFDASSPHARPMSAR